MGQINEYILKCLLGSMAFVLMIALLHVSFDFRGNEEINLSIHHGLATENKQMQRERDHFRAAFKAVQRQSQLGKDLDNLRAMEANHDIQMQKIHKSAKSAVQNFQVSAQRASEIRNSTTLSLGSIPDHVTVVEINESEPEGGEARINDEITEEK